MFDWSRDQHLFENGPFEFRVLRKPREGTHVSQEVLDLLQEATEKRKKKK